MFKRVIAPAVLASAAGLAVAQEPTVLITTVPGLTTSAIPGGAAGEEFSNFAERPFASPSGNYWIVKGGSNAAQTYTVGQGMSFGTALRSDDPAPWNPSFNVGITFINDVAINDNGGWNFVTTVANTLTLARTDGTDWFADVEGETTQVPGLPGVFVANFFIQKPVLTNDGRSGYTTLSLDLPAATRNFLILGDQILSQSGVNVPTNQPSGEQDTIKANAVSAFGVSGDGNTWMTEARLRIPGNFPSGTQLRTVVVNNDAKMQTLHPFGTFASPVVSIHNTTLSGVGDWLSRASNDDGHDFVVRNGDIIAQRGAPIFDGATELFDDGPFAATFFVNVGGPDGDYLVGGTTDNPDSALNSVIVLNNERVIARRGDAVSIDGQTFTISSFANNSAAFLDDAVLIVANLSDAAGTSVGSALLHYDLDAAPTCPADLNGDGVVDADDFFLFLSLFASGDPRADINADGVIDADDFFAYLSLFAAGC
ncbi:MAG: hypothetical protein EA423_11790 [Phycisphaerales bacterium]|nr:MAG: hypothetical protein EA423_11790 [Phycisphaerales bacterium]